MRDAAQTLYQRDVMRMGVEGRVEAIFRIGIDGAVSDCSVHRSSGAPELDALACKAIDRFPRAPIHLDAEGNPSEVPVVLPFKFVLVAAEPPAAPDGEQD